MEAIKAIEAAKEDSSARPRRVLAVHDLSCFGRCALTVIIPTLSSMGHQAVPLPTALLSTHTGGFTGIHFVDLTEHMLPIAEHLDSLGIEFDAIYTGFLGSAAQVDIVQKIIEHSRSKHSSPFVLVDPVMGDDGVLYSTYTPELVDGMKRLCRAAADMITPNLTEACLLTDIEYKDTSKMDASELDSYCERLISELYARYSCLTVISGIVLANESIMTLAYDGHDTVRVESRHLPAMYPGTGDIFASVILGNILNGKSFFESVRGATEFVSLTVSATMPIDEPKRDGVAIEKLLKKL